LKKQIAVSVPQNADTKNGLNTKCKCRNQVAVDLRAEVYKMLMHEKIKQLRQEKGVSQSKLAKMVGTTQQLVNQWENNQKEPRLYNCINLADIFGVSLDELCCREFKGR
jgi:DNA-binding XRE family transcriptional regulator